MMYYKIWEISMEGFIQSRQVYRANRENRLMEGFIRNLHILHDT